MAREKIAIIYDDSLRQDTTGGYCLRALEQLAQVQHFRPDQIGEIDDSFDLYLGIDDGLEYRFPRHLTPSVFWAIDTHLNLTRAPRRARDFQYCFSAQREGAARLLREGINHCEWLPLACDPEIHRKLELERDLDVAFVGHVIHSERQQLLEGVRERFPNCFIGPAPHTQIAEIYSRAKIVINCCINNDLNMRVFEALSCGALLVTNQLNDNGQEEFFADKVHLAEYRSPEEALELIDYYLRHPQEREKVAAAGNQEVIGKHTYKLRMQALLARTKELIDGGVQVNCEAVEEEPVVTVSQDRQYFHWPRHDLLELVPDDAARVLDVGCAAGVLGENIRCRQKCEVVGIELHPGAAAEARERLDEVLEADVETAELGPLGQFDTVICGDVLEHLREPGQTLAKLRGLLKPTGTLIASFPNVRNLGLVQGLVEGNWSYEPSGLLDRTHLRFFTRRSAEQLLDEAGFDVTRVHGLPDGGYRGWQEAGKPSQVQAGRLELSGFTENEAAEFFVSQWLMVARPVERVEWGLTSIVMLTWNQLSFTRMCIESLRKHTHLPYELIVVDNGSTDGTVDWLRAQSDIKLICNATNQGFAKGCNQGIRVATGENLLLLNNDTLLTPGWLRRMLERLHSAPEVGMVGPRSNRVVGAQTIPVPYRNVAEIDGFAWEMGRHERGQWSETGMLVGFCLLAKRSTYDKIGLLDEQFKIGTFEDTDICWRAVQAGYKLLICHDAFVHHFGSQTFSGNKLPVVEILEENRQLFEKKWGIKPKEVEPKPELKVESKVSKAEEAVRAAADTQAEKPAQWRVGRHGSGGLTLEDKSIISLCMIVRDEADKIADCLTSIKPYVDEMIVVDTGSTDRTAEIAAELGAKVIHSFWQDSFSAARNVSLDHATGDWIFWLDADDVVDEASGVALRQSVESAPEGILGFVAQVHCPAGPGEEGETVVDHVKLFRNRPDLRFELRIHEQILPSLRRAGGEIARAPIHVTHKNYDHSPAGQRKKRARDAKLLALDLTENPQHPFVHFNIGMTALHEREYDKAIKHLRESIDLSAPQDSQVRKAYALLAFAHRGKEEAQQALAVCQEGRKIYPDDPELMFNEALAWQQAQDYERAERVFLQLLNSKRQGDYLASVDTGIYSYKARHNLGALYEQQGKRSQAEACWREVINDQPNFFPSWLALGELLLEQDKAQEVDKLARQAERISPTIAGMLRGRAAMRNDDYRKAEEQFRRIVKAAPQEPEGWRFLSHALLQRGERQEVEGVLRRLIELSPDDGEAYHNLASLLLEQARPAEAISYYQRSIELRPSYLPSQQMLQEAMRKLSGGPMSPTFGLPNVTDEVKPGFELITSGKTEIA